MSLLNASSACRAPNKDFIVSLVYNEEQQLLGDSARDFLATRSPVALQRTLRDDKTRAGFDTTLWNDMLELGWGGIALPEAYGGLEFGFQGFAPVFEHIGRQLCATPLLSSVVLCGSLIEALGSEEQKQSLLSALISGEVQLAAALDEQHSFRPGTVAASARLDGDAVIISGADLWVPDGLDADAWLVVCRVDTDNDSRLVVVQVPATTAAVTVEPLQLLDSRNHISLTLRDVRLPTSALLGRGDALDAVELALDRATACMSAELLGASLSMFETTLEYLKTRVQFKQPIGSFQALQHRASWLYTELELTKSAVMAAFEALDDPQVSLARRRQLVSLAKWKAGLTAHKVSSEAVQMHGGIGVTDELDLGLYLKRVRVAEVMLGDSDFHCERYAQTVKDDAKTTAQ